MTLDDLVGLLREQQLVCDLQVVGVSNVPLHGVLDGVGAGEELLARLLLVSTGVGIHVLIEQLPHVVGQVQDLKVLGIPARKIFFMNTPHDAKLECGTYWNPVLNFWATVP